MNKMRVNSQQQAEIINVYETFLKSLLHAELEKYASFLDPDFRLIGTTEAEVFFSRDDAVRFLEKTGEQLAGNLERRNSKLFIEAIDGLIFITDQFDAWVRIEGAWIFYAKTRVSSWLRHQAAGWKMIQQHFSFPDSKTQEGETVGLEKISQENLQLREAVKRRTIELEQKNRELEIEASLERVRAQAMGMKKPEDLLDVCEAVFKELDLLGFSELRNSMINIYDDEKEFLLNYDYSSVVGKTVTGFSYHIHPIIETQVKHLRSSSDAFYEIVIEGEELEEFRKFRMSNGEADDPRFDDSGTVCYYFYSTGIAAIGISTFSIIGEEKRNTLRRFRNVFDFAYRRYMDVARAEAHAAQAASDLILLKEEKRKTETALTELKATQSQLIQSEKMASLGQLTSGIAHEIQNPLNFVNNFSEVSAEMIDEAEQAIGAALSLSKGNRQKAASASSAAKATGNSQVDEEADILSILKGVKQNLEKISHHGKRADAIVKSMMLHSRPGSDRKEPTDVNALADKYLRLVYHGLRGKDNTLHVDIHTDYDSSIGEVELIQEDISRVLLNILSNAFYAVHEKAKLLSAGDKEKIMGYEPAVSLSTKKSVNQIFIAIKDNGGGIAANILDKIFQPFFTTKPTGQGTGLGLSLAYDIVKTHGGEIKVSSTEGQGSEFTIILNESK